MPSPARHNRLFVLDTSVLMHDPTALFRFEEHDVHLPMAVLEELDRAKKGVSEEARNVRQVSRFLDELLSRVGLDSLRRGVPLDARDSQAQGRLYFDLHETAGQGDEAILATALELQHSQPDRPVVLVSKDINLRIRATVRGIQAEDYASDRVLDDLDLLYSGAREVPAEQWRGEGEGWWLDQGADLQLNEYVHSPDHALQGIVRERAGDAALVAALDDYTEQGEAVWGIHARNPEQNFALNLLLDPELDFVTLLGAAGTGKTLLTLAAALAQVLESQRYGEIIMTRATIALGEDIGFLPGSEEEKMTPWMGALMDNLEVLTQPDQGGSWARAATQDLLNQRIKIRSLNFMRGRTFLNKFIILDEAQNLTAKQMKALITRAGPGSKLVCLGNIAQIDTPYLTGSSSGLTYVVDRFQGWAHGGHITLRRGERSRLADFASETL
ncbi:PhoH family protein [Alkalilimnicola sp. S0819]|uniref:PhoH family protein n=1 Tax=Alkalilimnicola sp. S0819 TaxID=2613922 RepID=UPI001261417A|nr:PhoH family protein [Alkalilimnicola sp. S0819]KAB7628307.1 PhoH family protein [Alkalilimnicola sp. S0819]MPQ15205.1 AAA family ATPase [Alkalilimnicola sp. S0819]